MAFTRLNFLSKKHLEQARVLVREIMGIIANIQIPDHEFEEKFEQTSLRTKKPIKELILGCLIPAFCQNIALLCDSYTGYTLIVSEENMNIYGSSFLSLQGINPKWIICHDIFKTNNKTFCRIAQQVEFKDLQEYLPKDILLKHQLEYRNRS